MYILGFETTGPIGSVAIIDLDKVSPDGYLMGDDAICMKTTDEPMSHLKNVMSLAKELLEEKGISTCKGFSGEPVCLDEVDAGESTDSQQQIAAVAASIGPGSFTGIRIGVTEARAMAQALGVPAISVPTLEVFREHTFEKEQRLEKKVSAFDRECEGTRCDDSSREYAGGRVCGIEYEKPVVAAILNARRGQVYGAIYGPEGEIIKEPGPYMLTDILEITDKYQNAVFYGDGVDAYQTQLTEGGKNGPLISGVKDNTRDEDANCENACFDFEGFRRFLVAESRRYQTADLVVLIAAKKYMVGDTVAAEELLPDYMRLAEAEQKLNDGTLQKLREAKMARMRHK